MTSRGSIDATIGAGDVSPTSSSGLAQSSNAKMRKRTKTGCLTCRKRRIKCGEERPTCANCIKSKRQCEGYNQRVVFKPPIGDWPNHPGVVSTLQYHSSTLPGSRPPGFRSAQSLPQGQDSGLASIQPRPLTQFEYQADPPPPLAQLNTQHAYMAGPRGYGPESGGHQPLASPHQQLPTPTSAASYLSQQSPTQAHFQGQYGDTVAPYVDQHRLSQGQYPQMPASYTQHHDRKLSEPRGSVSMPFYHHQHAATRSEHTTHFDPSTNISPRSNLSPQSNLSSHSSITTANEDFASMYAEHRPPVHSYASSQHIHGSRSSHASIDHGQVGAYAIPMTSPTAHSPHAAFQRIPITPQDMTQDVKYMPQHAVYGMSNI